MGYIHFFLVYPKSYLLFLAAFVLMALRNTIVRENNFTYAKNNQTIRKYLSQNFTQKILKKFKLQMDINLEVFLKTIQTLQGNYFAGHI